MRIFGTNGWCVLNLSFGNFDGIGDDGCDYNGNGRLEYVKMVPFGYC